MRDQSVDSWLGGAGVTYKYDVFISHASEDKGFVRPLAEALRAHRLAVWYDEFELKPGMGLRESIDEGLLSSRFGLVVLSPAFFAKSWPRWELDGLVQLAHSRPEPVIVPVWHKVNHPDVAGHSPSLANIVAIPSHDDPALTANQVLRLLRPRPTAVELAREVLIEFGFPAPVLSDDWWLEAAAWSAPRFGEGTFQEASSWGWWGLPLPPAGEGTEEKGRRLAWAAMQHSWQQVAIVQRVTQCAHPDRVLDFIQGQPGLAVAAESALDYVLCYAPQLGIRGFGGFLEPAIESLFEKVESSIRARPSWSAPGWVVRCRDLCGLSPEDFVDRYFWPADPACTSPDASVLAWVDAAAWVVSSLSEWLPSAIRSHLTRGLSARSVHRMTDGSADTWDISDSEQWFEVMFHGPDALDMPTFVGEATKAFEERLASSRKILELPESPAELASQISAWRVLEKYWTYRAEHRS